MALYTSSYCLFYKNFFKGHHKLPNPQRFYFDHLVRVSAEDTETFQVFRNMLDLKSVINSLQRSYYQFYQFCVLLLVWELLCDCCDYFLRKNRETLTINFHIFLFLLVSKLVLLVLSLYVYIIN
jgi:hypothetical protein